MEAIISQLSRAWFTKPGKQAGAAPIAKFYSPHTQNMAQMITAGGSLVNKLPIPKSIRIVVFNALKAKGNNFLRHEALPGHARTSRIEPLTAFTAKDDTPDFEVISTSKANPLGTARIESKVLLQDMEDCPQSFGEIGVSSGLEVCLDLQAFTCALKALWNVIHPLV